MRKKNKQNKNNQLKQQQLQRQYQHKQENNKHHLNNTNKKKSMANKLGETAQQQQQQYDNKTLCNSNTDITANNSSGNGNEAFSLHSDTTNHNEINATAESTAKEQQQNERKKNILAHGKLNDLVADLCLNGPRTHNKSLDFNNSRLNNGAPDVFMDNINNGVSNSATSPATGTTITTTTTSSSFSFKHFLSNSNRDMTAPSSTVTSLDPIIIPSDLNGDSSASNPKPEKILLTSEAAASSISNIADPNKPYQTSTGARPKIPQSSSVSTSSICSLMSNARISDTSSTDHLNYTLSGGTSGKMKRSPRFSSFDSQASLAEYASATASSQSDHFFAATAAGGATALFHDDGAAADIFNTSAGLNCASASGLDITRKYVPRSYSNYDMPPTASPRRRTGVYSMDQSLNSDNVFGRFLPNNNNDDEAGAEVGAAGGCAADVSEAIGLGLKESRPTRLALNSNNNACNESNKYKLDIPMDQHAPTAEKEEASGVAGNGNVPTPSAFAASAIAAAATLPDFVQDHWLETWQVQESMRLNSPATSPVTNVNLPDNGFGFSLSSLRGRLAPANLALARTASGMKLGAPNFCGVIGDKRGSHKSNSDANANSSLSQALEQHQQLLQQQQQPSISNQHQETTRSLSLDLGGNESVSLRDENMSSQSNAVGSKMLPDFLADGPIIHSAQRLADVATGLPANPVGSPNEATMSTQLTNLRHDNERLQRELNETIMALNEQMRRADHMERQNQSYHHQMQMQLQQHAINTSKEIESKENAQSEVIALRLHLADLQTELDKLRVENAVWREGGAVGGTASVANCNVNVAGGEATAKVASGLRSDYVGRPMRTQPQISRDLLLAATNAESNLRQLLNGVENLRQIADEIENGNWRTEKVDEINPNMYADFDDDCDDPFQEFRSGPAL